MYPIRLHEPMKLMTTEKQSSKERNYDPYSNEGRRIQGRCPGVIYGSLVCDWSWQWNSRTRSNVSNGSSSNVPGNLVGNQTLSIYLPQQIKALRIVVGTKGYVIDIGYSHEKRKVSGLRILCDMTQVMLRILSFDVNTCAIGRSVSANIRSPHPRPAWLSAASKASPAAGSSTPNDSTYQPTPQHL